MSDTSDATRSSDNSPGRKTRTKPRNSVERLIVWGLIAALLVVAAVEASAKFGYDQTLARLQTALAADEGPDGKGLHIDEVSALLSGFPSRSESDVSGLTRVNYRWPSLFRSYGVQLEYRKSSGNILGLATEEAPEPTRPIAPVQSETPSVPEVDADAPQKRGEPETRDADSPR